MKSKKPSAKSKKKAGPVAKKGKKAATLPSTELDLWKKCPEEELEECLVYECARRSDLWRLVFETLRYLDRPESFESSDSTWSRVYEFLCAFPKFPDASWLETKTRAQRLEAVAKRAFPEPAIEDCHINEAICSDESIDADPFDERQTAGPFWSDGCEILSKYRPRDRYLGAKFHVLRITWWNSDEKIQNEFSKWLQRYRPDEFMAYNRRGKTSVRGDSMRAALRGLAAWSLSRKLNPLAPSDLSRQKAWQATAHPNEHGVSEKLYSDEKAFGKAANAAAMKIREVESDGLWFSHKNRLPPCALEVRGNETYVVQINDAGQVVFRRKDTAI